MIQISAHTTLYGIIGSPVKHSLSPKMHNAAFRALGIDAVYLAFETSDTKSALDAMKCLGIKGYSVTIPNKQNIINYLDDIDQTVKQIGACNTVKNLNNKLIGTNTDWLGGILPLEKRTNLKGKKVTVLGAGGSARAICYGLLKKGAIVNICNRTVERANALAKDFNCSAFSLLEANKLKGDILINTTSVGMYPLVDNSPVQEDTVKNFNIIMDIVYSPLETKLLQMAKKLKKEIITGVEMLLYQAVAQFEFWTEQKAPVEIMRKALEENV